MKDKISIITTFYNSEKYIFKAIHSVNSQIINDDFDVEYIIINDHSEDQSLDIINLYFNELKNDKIDVRILTTPQNLGAGGSRKFGISHATGNYLMFLDSDDYYINQNLLIKLYSVAKKYDADMIEFGLILVDKYSYSHEYYCVNQPLVLDNNKLSNMITMFQERNINFMPWTKFVKKSIIDTIEYSESRTFDDIQTTPVWVYNSNKIIILNSVEVNYRCTNNSTFRKSDENVKYETVLALSSLFDYFKDNINILKLIYERSLIDLKSILTLDSNNEYFNKMSKLNTKMLSYIYPDDYQNMTYNVE